MKRLIAILCLRNIQKAVFGWRSDGLFYILAEDGSKNAPGTVSDGDYPFLQEAKKLSFGSCLAYSMAQVVRKMAQVGKKVGDQRQECSL